MSAEPPQKSQRPLKRPKMESGMQSADICSASSTNISPLHPSLPPTPRGDYQKGAAPRSNGSADRPGVNIIFMVVM